MGEHHVDIVEVIGSSPILPTGDHLGEGNKMKNYIATRKRAYWVEETMHIEAENSHDARHTFFNDFCVELEVKDVFTLGDKQFDEGVEIVETVEMDSAELLDQQRQILKFRPQEVEDE